MKDFIKFLSGAFIAFVALLIAINILGGMVLLGAFVVLGGAAVIVYGLSQESILTEFVGVAIIVAGLLIAGVM